MNATIIKRVTGNTILLALVLGVICGTAILFFLELPGEWGILGLAGLTVPFLCFYTQNLKRFFTLILVFFIPINASFTFSRYPQLISGPQGLSIALSDIALVGLLFLWAGDLATHRRKIRFYPEVTLPYIGIVSMALISIQNSVNVQISWFEIILMIKLLILFLYVANNVNTNKDIKLILIVLFFGFGFESLIGFLQYIKQAPLGLTVIGESDEVMEFALDDRMAYRIGATLGHTNMFSKYLSLLLPSIACTFFVVKTRLLKILSAILFAFGSVVLIMTLTRSAWIGFIFSLGIVIYYFKRNKSLWRKARKSIIGVCILFLIVGLASSGIILSRITSDDHGSAEIRIPLMQIAFSMIRANPIFGVGINNYTIVMFDYDFTVDQVASKFPHPVHNVYLLYAAEIGLLGLLFYLLTIGKSCWDGLMNGKSQNTIVAAISIGFSAGIISLMVQSFMDWGFKHSYSLLTLAWVQIGCIYAMKTMNKPDIDKNNLVEELLENPKILKKS